MDLDDMCVGDAKIKPKSIYRGLTPFYLNKHILVASLWKLSVIINVLKLCILSTEKSDAIYKKAKIKKIERESW